MKHWGTSLGLIILLCISLTGASCRTTKEPNPFTLKYWTVYTDAADIDTALSQFKAKYPYVSVEVRRFKPEEYEDKLIEAWSHNEGPDIFSIPNWHLGKFKSYIKPLPPTIILTSVTEKKSFAKTQRIITPETIATMSLQKLSNTFPQVVYNDVALTDQAKAILNQPATKKIFGLPMSLDTLALYYNKDLLNKAGIPLPPVTWDEFVKQVPAPKLTLLDVNDQIVQSGVALGTSNNIPFTFDILSLLMLQNGAKMTNGEQANFSDEATEEAQAAGAAQYPGVQAVEFYTNFSRTDPNDWYTWNSDQPDALEAFLAGTTAFYFGYHYQLEQMKTKAPNLNFDVAAVPQVDTANPVNYASYWVETVANSSTHADEAWGLLLALTTDKANVQAYLEKTKQPAALKALFTEQQNDFVLSIFDQQALTAKSWYQGIKPQEAEAALAEMITLINENTLDVPTAVSKAEEKINLTYSNEDQ